MVRFIIKFSDSNTEDAEAQAAEEEAAEAEREAEEKEKNKSKTARTLDAINDFKNAEGNNALQKGVNYAAAKVTEKATAEVKAKAKIELKKKAQQAINTVLSSNPIGRLILLIPGIKKLEGVILDEILKRGEKYLDQAIEKLERAVAMALYVVIALLLCCCCSICFVIFWFVSVATNPQTYLNMAGDAINSGICETQHAFATHNPFDTRSQQEKDDDLYQCISGVTEEQQCNRFDERGFPELCEDI